MSPKKIALTLLLSAAAAFQASGAPMKRLEFKQTPRVNLIGNPEYNVMVAGAQPKRPRPPEPGEMKQWLEFEVDFDALEDIPELTLKYSLLVQTAQTKTFKLIEGEVNHVEVTKGRDRHSVIYVAPKTLAKVSEKMPFNAQTVVKAYWVDATVQGEQAALRSFKGNGVTMEQIEKDKEKLEKINDGFLNKSQTPFAPLFIDYYEAMKVNR